MSMFSNPQDDPWAQGKADDDWDTDADFESKETIQKGTVKEQITSAAEAQQRVRNDLEAEREKKFGIPRQVNLRAGDDQSRGEGHTGERHSSTKSWNVQQEISGAPQRDMQAVKTDFNKTRQQDYVSSVNREGGGRGANPPVRANPPAQQAAPVRSNPPAQQSAPVRANPPAQQSAPVRANPPAQQSAPVRANPPAQQSAPPVVRANPPAQQAAPPVVRANPPAQQSAPPVVRAAPPAVKAAPPPPVVKAAPPPPVEESWDQGGDQGWDNSAASGGDQGWDNSGGGDQGWDNSAASGGDQGWDNSGGDQGWDNSAASGNTGGGNTASAGEGQCKAVYEYVGEGEGDLSFYEGEIITILDTSDPSGWWEGELNGVRGFFPSNFVEKM